MASCRTLDRQVWMTETSKRHHSVPRAYLRRFTDDDGLLFQHERGQEGAVQVPPHKAAERISSTHLKQVTIPAMTR